MRHTEPDSLPQLAHLERCQPGVGSPLLVPVCVGSSSDLEGLILVGRDLCPGQEARQRRYSLVPHILLACQAIINVLSALFHTIHLDRVACSSSQRKGPGDGGRGGPGVDLLEARNLPSGGTDEDGLTGLGALGFLIFSAVRLVPVAKSMMLGRGGVVGLNGWVGWPGWDWGRPAGRRGPECANLQIPSPQPNHKAADYPAAGQANLNPPRRLSDVRELLGGNNKYIMCSTI